MDESVKFAWAYLILHGKLTSGEWCCYGGCWEGLHGINHGSWDEEQKSLEALRKKIPYVGIDWDKTKVPTVSDEGIFNGTFNEGGNCLATLGRLFLKGGTDYLLGSSDDDAAHLAETARKIIKGKSDPVTLLAAKL